MVPLQEPAVGAAAERGRRGRSRQCGNWRAILPPPLAYTAPWPHPPTPSLLCRRFPRRPCAGRRRHLSGSGGRRKTHDSAGRVAKCAAAAAADVGAEASDGSTSDRDGSRENYGAVRDVSVLAGGLTTCCSSRPGGAPLVGTPAGAPMSEAPTEACVDATHANNGGGGNDGQTAIVCGAGSKGGPAGGVREGARRRQGPSAPPGQRHPRCPRPPRTRYVCPPPLKTRSPAAGWRRLPPLPATESSAPPSPIC